MPTAKASGPARELARRCEWEPALQWLTGCETVNYHTLSSFRVEYRVELDELFTQVLGRMSATRAATAAGAGTRRTAETAPPQAAGASPCKRTGSAPDAAGRRRHRAQ